MSYADSSMLTVLFNAVGIPARLLTGYAADRFTGALNGVIILTALTGVMAFAWVAVHSVPG